LGENEIETAECHRRMLPDDIVCCRHLLKDWTSSFLSFGYFLNESGMLLFIVKLLANHLRFHRLQIGAAILQFIGCLLNR